MKIKKNFKCEEKEWDNCQFVRLQIESASSKTIIHQKHYILKLQKLSMKDKFNSFISLPENVFGVQTLTLISRVQ